MTEIPLITTRQEAIDFLDGRIASGVRPGLERIAGVLELMGDPHRTLPVIHVAGTNGKTTVVRMIRDLLLAHDFRVGTFTSPHLDRVEERFSIDGETIDELGLVEAVADIAPFVARYEELNDTTVTYFEATTAAAFAAFQSAGVDVAVVEVGLGGRLDATNVVTADVCVITGIAIDHTSYLGDTLAEIATEKAAILDNRGILVTGRLPAAAEGSVTARVAETGAEWIRFGDHFDVTGAELAVGGWLASIGGTQRTYEDIFLPLHGFHQVDHLATAIAAVETFLAGALDPERLVAAVATTSSPGRLEVVARGPLVLIDGAHNAEGLEGLAMALDGEFPDTRRILVVGFQGDRRPGELLHPLGEFFEEVITTRADDPLAVPADEVATQARTVFAPGIPIEPITPVDAALTEALRRSGPTDMIVVAGSLYVVGEARRRFVAGIEPPEA